MIAETLLKAEPPRVTPRLLDAMRAWEDWLNSGSAPTPGVGGLCSAERMAEAGKQSEHGPTTNLWDEVRDVSIAVRVDDSFHKMALQQQVCIRTRFLWSAWTPLVRARHTPWAQVRQVEAEHAKLPESVYERVLASAINELERACG